MDAGGADAVRRYVEATALDFPVVLDMEHRLGALFAVVNVPSGIWVDENGVIVRPPETAYPAKPAFADLALDDPDATSRFTEAELARFRAVRPLSSQMRIDPETYIGALRDWVRHGSASRYALPPEEVVARSRPRPVEEGQAAAAFELGQHLHRVGDTAGAVTWFRESHRLQPDNWTYRRQAWSLTDPSQGPTAEYDSDWITDVRRSGPENYYAPLQMDPL
ncbi:MAG: hypothetical protein NVSMB13_21730 [Mycobacteriales bacterium]